MLNQDHLLSKCPPKLRDKVVKDLLDIYHNPPWGGAVGMAAPQIGYPYNIFVAQGQVFENVQRILPVDRTATGKSVKTESCFSLPHEVHAVQRYYRIKVKVGDKYTEYYGYKAQVIQHEFDHIRGKLINGKE